VVYNPKWLQIIFYIAILAFPTLALYMGYVSYEEYSQKGIAGAAYYIFAFIAGIYISYFGLMYLKYVAAKVTFDETMLKVNVKGSEVEYIWDDIVKVKNYEHAQLLKLTDGSGKTVVVVDHMSPGYSGFKTMISERVGI
jgi:hypothetical protein